MVSGDPSTGRRPPVAASGPRATVGTGEAEERRTAGRGLQRRQATVAEEQAMAIRQHRRPDTSRPTGAVDAVRRARHCRPWEMGHATMPMGLVHGGRQPITRPNSVVSVGVRWAATYACSRKKLATFPSTARRPHKG
ncbi:hypothetical protein U9M48_007569 [Paspalum notatum var. saurae]|uniref:Uncharacterized protein n=1 Tax=Paspalum notatum var. saurae TaxID=547442 RepID=A0AAQ3PUT2_PASNO